MNFWDSSAVLPLLLREQASDPIRECLGRDPDVVVWWATLVECQSALWRRYREGLLSLVEARGLETRGRTLLDAAFQVQPVEAVRDRAGRLLAVHSLRAADSLQLAAALEWVAGRPEQAGFVCLDARLREAAALEGFRVLPGAP